MSFWPGPRQKNKRANWLGVVLTSQVYSKGTSSFRPSLGGAFLFLCSPRKLWNMSYLTNKAFFRWVGSTTSTTSKKNSTRGSPKTVRKQRRRQSTIHRSALLGPDELSWREVVMNTTAAYEVLGGGNSNIFLWSPRKLGKISILTNIFQRDWNHQLELICRGDF